jgi:LacI family transcriptional regulator, galactose operon repressor
MVGTDKGRASIHDVARRAGVSAATVSKVLRGVTNVKPANVEKVRDAVRDLGYRMDPLASGLRRRTRRIIGIVLPELESEFFGRLTARIEILAEQAGYSLAIATSHESEQRERDMIERMHDWRVAGTILAPVRSERGMGAVAMKQLGMTGVLVDRVMANDSFDTVTADNERASARVARTLIEAGHRHVLLVALNEVSKNVRTRISAFKAEAAASCPEMKVDILFADGPIEDIGRSLSRYLASERPSAVFSLFQKGTLAVLSEFRRLGILCPQDISVVGFDDAQWMQATFPAVSAVVQPIGRIAEQAFVRLLARIDGQPGFPVCLLEHCDFQERESLKYIGDEPEVRTLFERQGNKPLP